MSEDWSLVTEYCRDVSLEITSGLGVRPSKVNSETRLDRLPRQSSSTALCRCYCVQQSPQVTEVHMRPQHCSSGHIGMRRPPAAHVTATLRLDLKLIPGRHFMYGKMATLDTGDVHCFMSSLHTLWNA